MSRYLANVVRYISEYGRVVQSIGVGYVREKFISNLLKQDLKQEGAGRDVKYTKANANG